MIGLRIVCRPRVKAPKPMSAIARRSFSPLMIGGM
jgi:hypothetical protein